MRSPLTNWSGLLRTRLSALLPCVCALCGETAAQPLCEPCRRQFVVQPTQRCRCCALPSPALTAASPLCGACLATPPPFDATLVAADYQAPLDQLVLALKFTGKLALAPLLGKLLLDATLAGHDRTQALPMLLAPVPLSALRLRERGFNQALEIARPLSRALGVPLAARLLERVRETRAQAELPLAERHANLRRAFVVSPAAIDRVAGRHIGVVDDVMTTGATLNEVAATLKRFGATRVTNLVFARTLPN